MLITLIETITYLHQFQREKKVDQSTGEEFIETTAEDILKGYELFYPILLRKSDELNGSTRNFYNWLAENVKSEEEFYANEIREKAKLHPRTLRRYLKSLREYGRLVIVGGNKKKGFAYQIIPEAEAIEPILQKHLQSVKKKLEKLAKS